MTSVLSSLFTRDPKAAFPYEIPEDWYCHASKGVLAGASFRKSDPSDLATCFCAGSSDSRAIEVLKKQVQKLKTIRHPNVLSYWDSIEIDTTFYLITEPCLPLELYFERMKFSSNHKNFVISWGIFQLLNCLNFLHHEVKLSHESLNVDSIFIRAEGDWKIGGFENSISFTNPRTDLNALGSVIWFLYNGTDSPVNISEAPCKNIPERLLGQYKKMITSQAARLDAGELLREMRRPGGYLKNRFVDALLFLDEFQLKDSHEKQAFFTRLKDELQIFPSNIAKHRILPKLIQSHEYGDAGSHVLAPLFQLGQLLDAKEYQQEIVPYLCKLFKSPDRATRVKLLERIDEYARHLTSQIVNEKIYGNIATGFMDTNPAVRESTVKAVVLLADKLNNQNLNTDLMRHLARLQGTDDQPGIRTNTTICLGKIACYIDPNQRQRILISAFTRALKDPFPPARIAAILALSATQQYYSLVEVANRILPALSPMTCDPEKQVRDQSFKALHGFIEKLEKASENPELIPELEAQVKAGGKSGLLSSDKVPQWASWALKSLSGKFYKSASTVENPSESVIKNEPLRPELTPVGEKSVSKPSETSSLKHGNDGWGELEDGLSSENEEKWEDANDGITDTMKSINVWDDEWEEFTKTEKKSSTTTSSNPSKNSTRTGGLKLQPAVKKSTVDDDLDYLLGIKVEATDFNRPSANGDEKFSVMNIAGTKDMWSDSGWDEFNIPSGEISAQTSTGEGWDDTSWSDVKPTEAQLTSQNKESRRAEIAARNEARRKEMARKRAARGVGAVRLGSGSSKNVSNS